jgi:hypothetical protein
MIRAVEMRLLKYEVIILATRSIIHSVHIQQKEHAKAFVAALERAQMKKKRRCNQ